MSGAEPLRGGSTSARSVESLLRHPSFRFTTRLIGADHRSSIFLGECADDRNDVENDPSSSAAAQIPGFISDTFATFSKPIVVLDLVWNLAFIVVAVTALITTLRERPSTPLRLWLCGYALQCLFHVGFMFVEFRRTDYDEILFYRTHFRMIKRLESVNTIMSSIWWVFGFYWIVVGGQTLIQDSPRLYWLTVVFLAFDVFFVIFCIGMALVVFLALFCLAVAYAVVASTEGASEDIIQGLPKHLYRGATSFDSSFKKQEVAGTQSEEDGNSCSDTNELFLNPDDAECCICLSSYVDGAELSALPCKHHFHNACIRKWLLINATCPLCKFSILSRDTLV